MDSTKKLAYISALYVEDDDMTREELSKFLKRRLGKLYTAKNGEEGLDIFLKLTPDIVITDIRMSPKDGLSMAEGIRRRGFQTPIIITSALSDSNIILDAVNIGIVKYVVKPVDTDLLLSALNEVSHLILEKKNNILHQSNIYDRELIKEIEKLIKSELSSFIKSKSGKGPRNIVVSFAGNMLKIVLNDALTSFEVSIIEKRRNFEIVNFTRETFYRELKKQLEEIIEKCINRKVELKNVSIDSEKNIDEIGFLMLN